MHKNEEHFYEPELFRVKGDLLLQSHGPELEAEACFHQAIDVARRQNTKTFELRAVISLSRLWKKIGKRHEARQLLGEIHIWFTEGFDTADVRNAEALLEGLN
jgi:predicted ATPase